MATGHVECHAVPEIVINRDGPEERRIAFVDDFGGTMQLSTQQLRNLITLLDAPVTRATVPSSTGFTRNSSPLLAYPVHPITSPAGEFYLSSCLSATLTCASIELYAFFTRGPRGCNGVY